MLFTFFPLICEGGCKRAGGPAPAGWLDAAGGAEGGVDPPGAGEEGAEDCASTEPKLKPVRAALAGAAAVPPNKAGVDAAGAPSARGEDAAALAARPKDRGADVVVEVDVEGRGVLMARANGADAAAEAVLAGVLGGMPGN